jgi:hypothetical protein
LKDEGIERWRGLKTFLIASCPLTGQRQGGDGYFYKGSLVFCTDNFSYDPFIFPFLFKIKEEGKVQGKKQLKKVFFFNWEEAEY